MRSANGSNVVLIWCQDGAETNPPASANPLASGDEKGLDDALDLWVGRAIKASKALNFGNGSAPRPVEGFEARLCGEAHHSKKLRPNNVPDVKTYIRETLKALRKDPRLHCANGPTGYHYWPAEVFARHQARAEKKAGEANNLPWVRTLEITVATPPHPNPNPIQLKQAKWY